MIVVEKGRSLAYSLAVKGKALATNRTYRDRGIVVAMNEDGSAAIAPVGSQGAEMLLRNPSRVVGIYCVRGAKLDLYERIQRDMRA